MGFPISVHDMETDVITILPLPSSVSATQECGCGIGVSVLFWVRNTDSRLHFCRVVGATHIARDEWENCTGA